MARFTSRNGWYKTPMLLAIVGASLVSGCASSSKKLTAVPGIGDSAEKGGQPVRNEEGAQVGISDSADVDRRPKMSAAAKSTYMRGVDAWQRADLPAAKTAFAEASQADPKAYQAFYSLGVVQECLGDLAALTSYRQAFTIVPDYEPAILAYANLVSKKDSALSEADQFLSEKRSSFPKSAAILAALAEVKSKRRDSGTAQQYAQEALKINPDYRPAMVILARDHYRNRRLDLALYALRAILDGEDANNPPRDKDNAEAHLLRGVIYKEQKKRSLAITEFEETTKLRPDLVEARVQLAAYLLESGNASEAAPLLETALRYNQSHIGAHMNLGDAYRLLGKTDEALREFEWVVSKDASLAEVHYSMGLLYLFSNQMAGKDGKQQVSAAIAEFDRFQKLRGKPTQGSSDDSDQLLLRARTKLEGIVAQEKAASAPPEAPESSPAASAAPKAAASGAAAPAASAPKAAASGAAAKPPAGSKPPASPEKP